MFSFASRVGSRFACLMPITAPPWLGSAPDPDSPADAARWLQARMLWLVSVLISLFGCLYSVYFASVGLFIATPIGPFCLLLCAGLLRFARRTGRYVRATDILSVSLFAAMAVTTLFQDGIRSPALWWMCVLVVGTLLVGRLLLGATLCALFAAQAGFLYLHGAGSIGPVSLLAGDPGLHLLLSMSLSALFVAVCVALNSYWGRQLRHALDRARAAAVAMASAKARFVSHVSHEIRTPLQGMIGATEMLQDPALAGPRRSRLLEIQRQSAGMLLSFVNDVLDFSKLDAGKVVLESRPLSLAAMVEDVLAYFGPQACAKRIDLSSSCSPDVPEVMLGDGTRIRQIITNLVSNAIKFTSEGSVHVHLGLDGHAAREAAAASGEMRVRVQVADSGVGIEPDRLPFLFKPFHQADESINRRFGGTGLGLSIADDLAHLMRGRIDVTSAVGRGSTFTLILPLAVSRQGASAALAARRPRAAAGAFAAAADVARGELGALPRSAAGLVVVVAEDDPANQIVVAAMLEALQARAIVVGDGRDALAAIEAGAVDVALMDVHMPGFDGLDAIRALRQRERFEAKAPLPVIAMTGSTEPAELAACFAAGMNMILTKPFDLAELGRVLHEARRAPPR